MIQVIAFRNVLIHGYASINHQIVWDAIRDDLSRPQATPAQLLRMAPPPQQAGFMARRCSAGFSRRGARQPGQQRLCALDLDVDFQE
jgi:hypothetical protein